jgi:hypothetical protein
MNTFSQASVIFRVSLLSVTLFFVINLQHLYARFVHNIGMLHYQQTFGKSNIVTNTWYSTSETLQEAIALNPTNASANLRLAGLFTLLGEYQTAEKYTQNGLLVLGKPRCYIEQHDFWRSVAMPKEYIPDQLLDFAHPQSRWNFEKIYLDTGNIFFDTNTDSKHCIARISADHDLTPNQFLWLWQEIKVMPGHTYQLSATVRSIGIERAWMGIKSQWTGIGILQKQGWQHIFYKFNATPTQRTETVQFVIDVGHGTLEIEHVTLEEVDYENRY